MNGASSSVDDASNGLPASGEVIGASSAGGAQELGRLQERRRSHRKQPATRLCTPAVQRVIDWHRNRSERRTYHFVSSPTASRTPQAPPDDSESVSEVGEEDPSAALEELAGLKTPNRHVNDPASASQQHERSASGSAA